jgi:predicted dehydrogenase
MSNKYKYRAGVIGCGRIGAGYGWDARPLATTHCGAYQACEDTELVAVYDKDEKRAGLAGEKFGVPFYTGNIDGFLETNPEIVSVCTPPESHIGGVSILSLEKSVKAIFCEKPIAELERDARTMVEDCGDILLFVDHQRRFNEYYRRRAEHIRDGLIGDIVAGSAYYRGGIENTGTHIVDLLRMFLGDATYVFCGPNDTEGDGFVKFGDAYIAMQQCELDTLVIFEIFLVGTRGTVRINDLNVLHRATKLNSRFDGYDELGRGNFSFPLEDAWQFDLLNGVRHIVECLDGVSEPMSTGRDGLEALRIINALECGGETWL